MVTVTLREDEWTALGGAVVLHLLLVVALVFQPSTPTKLDRTERMSVNLVSDIGLEATAPDPVAESAAAMAPVLSDEPAPAPNEQVTPPQPQPTVAPQPRPTTRAVRDERPRRRPDTPSTNRQSVAPPPASKQGGGSRIGSDFLPGSGSSTTTEDRRIPASQIGASAKASLVQAIARKIKPRWQPPVGPEVEQITTYLRFRLNPDGSLAGRPEVIRQTGVNDVNRAQAARHAENAVRAVQLAAPFDDLPAEYYNAWKLVSPFSFDWNLSQ
jgi:hypothetical protein